MTNKIIFARSQPFFIIFCVLSEAKGMDIIMKILIPKCCEEVYCIAAEEFKSFYEKVTGTVLPIIREPQDDDMIVIGSDAVNHYTAELMLSNKINEFKIRYCTDDYHIKTETVNGKKLLFLAGGRGRAVMYAVYRFFEVCAGCRYFWDGDIIANVREININDIDIAESPHFEYRGLRYFAHRSLHRFQAEHWSFEDWKKEIDWMLKKRLNMFMLRIGMDDLFQIAFPDIVDYPSNDEKLPEAGEGHHDRTTFWSLEYRGKLRKQILEYAFKRDLMHPEDCGTMTHWYSMTPLQFLEKKKPSLLSRDNKYEGVVTGKIWDVSCDENLNNYFKLTETHIQYYGKPEIFHTIGLAERIFSKDAENNLRLKLYTYRRITRLLQERYPNAKLFLASWDLWGQYRDVDEVQRLINNLNPEQSIILDYTSDTLRSNNFTNWNVVGKYPYIFGMFHAYEPNSDIRGNYDITNKRLAIASKDIFCKGMVFWPELSHSDTFALEYFADNAWNPCTLSVNERINKYCNDRYEMFSSKMIEIWSNFMPIASIMHWCINLRSYMPREWFFDIFERGKYMFDSKSNVFEEFIKIRKKTEKFKMNAIYALELAAEIMKDDTNNEFLNRDVYDIARTICGRYLQCQLINTAEVFLKCHSTSGTEGNYRDLLESKYRSCIKLMEILIDILSGHEDYSLFESFKKVKSVESVNPVFETTLKNNATGNYCRSYIYENAKYLYMPEMKLFFEWLDKIREENSIKELPYFELYYEKAKENIQIFFKTPLADMIPKYKKNISDILINLSQELKVI